VYIKEELKTATWERNEHRGTLRNNKELYELFSSILTIGVIKSSWIR
jgi:hypothetical protein